MLENKQKKLYYLLLTLVAVFFALSGYLEVTKNPVTYNKTLEMGYPPYFITTLGLAKICGSLVLLILNFRQLKNWVFAGFTFDVVFAFISGIMINSYADCIKSGIALCAILFTYSLFLKNERFSIKAKTIEK